MFNDILGAQKYSGRVLPKIPYGTKAVKYHNASVFVFMQYYKETGLRVVLARDEAMEADEATFSKLK